MVHKLGDVRCEDSHFLVLVVVCGLFSATGDHHIGFHLLHIFTTVCFADRYVPWDRKILTAEESSTLSAKARAILRILLQTPMLTGT